MLTHTKAYFKFVVTRFDSKAYGMVVAINKKEISFAQQGL
jgi:hypothetical protein